MGFVQQAHGKRQPTLAVDLSAGVAERIEVVADFLDVGIGGSLLVSLVYQQVDKRCLGSFDLQREDGFFAHEGVDEPVERRHHLARKVKDANPDADTIHFACAHWAVAEIIDAVEDELGVDVMTSHQAILWQALRTTGIDDRITGFGRLFREF